MPGTSCCGLRISSLAELESSKPTKRNCSRPMTARKPVRLGLRLLQPIVPAGLPFLIRNQATRPMKMKNTASLMKVPMLPVQRPNLSSMTERPTIAQTTTSPMTISHAVPIERLNMSELDSTATEVAARLPPIQVGLLIQ